MWPCHGATNQQITKDGSELKINGKCLDVSDGSTKANTRVIVWDCHGGANQKFKWNGKHIEFSGKCLDVENQTATKNGAQVVIANCGWRNLQDPPSQRWFSQVFTVSGS